MVQCILSTQSLDDYISGDKEAVQVSKVLQKYVGQTIFVTGIKNMTTTF